MYISTSNSKFTNRRKEGTTAIHRGEKENEEISVTVSEMRVVNGRAYLVFIRVADNEYVAVLLCKCFGAINGRLL